MKIVINDCYGGFGLSEEAMDMLEINDDYSIDRTNPVLIDVVEELGGRASGYCANLVTVEIPDEATDYYISEYDGMETVIYVVDGKIHYIS